jgi:hypothetical protein
MPPLWTFARPGGLWLRQRAPDLVTVPPTIQRLLEDKLLERIQAPEGDVTALWEKAVRSMQDSRNSQNSPDNQ